MFVVLSFCIYYILKNHSNIGDISSIICLILMVLIVLLTIPVGGLASFHIMLIFRGRTTNEQVTGKFKSNINPVKQKKNYFLKILFFDNFLILSFSLIMDIYLIAQEYL